MAELLAPEERLAFEEAQAEHAAEEMVCDMMDDGWFRAHGHRGRLLRIIRRLMANAAGREATPALLDENAAQEELRARAPAFRQELDAIDEAARVSAATMSLAFGRGAAQETRADAEERAEICAATDKLLRAFDTLTSLAQAPPVSGEEVMPHRPARTAGDHVATPPRDDRTSPAGAHPAVDDVAALRERLTDRPCRGVYIASKARHAPRWLALRAAGLPVISTWIDEAGEGESASLADLWRRCIAESASAAALLLYHEPGDEQKGAYVEVGAALASGVPVFVVGEPPGSWVNHALVTRCVSLSEASEKALAIASAPTRDPPIRPASSDEEGTP